MDPSTALKNLDTPVERGAAFHSGNLSLEPGSRAGALDLLATLYSQLE